MLARGAIRSQTILKTASSGTASRAPAIPHIQNQKISDSTIRTGFSVRENRGPGQ